MIYFRKLLASFLGVADAMLTTQALVSGEYGISIVLALNTCMCVWAFTGNTNERSPT